MKTLLRICCRILRAAPVGFLHVIPHIGQLSVFNPFINYSGLWTTKHKTGRTVESRHGQNGHESRLGHDFFVIFLMLKSRDQVVSRDHFCPHLVSGVKSKVDGPGG